MESPNFVPEGHMHESSQIPESRRNFLASLGTTALVAGAAMTPSVAEAMPTFTSPDYGWLSTLKGKKHKQLFDVPSINDGFGLAYALNFLDVYNKLGVADKDLGVVVVLRHAGAAIAVNDSIWSKYKLGTMLNVSDPKTKMAAERNRWRNPQPGDLPLPGMQLDKLQARGVIVGVCDVALTFLSMGAAASGGVTPEEAKREWVASLPAGAVVVPVGVIGVNQAQEKECTYCFGG